MIATLSTVHTHLMNRQDVLSAEIDHRLGVIYALFKNGYLLKFTQYDVEEGIAINLTTETGDRPSWNFGQTEQGTFYLIEAVEDRVNTISKLPRQVNEQWLIIATDKYGEEVLAIDKIFTQESEARKKAKGVGGKVIRCPNQITLYRG